MLAYADPFIIITAYHKTDITESILSPKQISVTITKLGNFFNRIYPFSEGCSDNNVTSIDYDGKRETFQFNSDYELRQNLMFWW